MMQKKFYQTNIRQYGDDRGKLTTVEVLNDIPFEIKRVYYISDVKENKKRACHAHKKSRRVLFSIQGSCKAKLFDGNIEEEFILNSKTKGVYFDKLVWCELSEFKDNAIVFVLADDIYDESDYIRNYEEFLQLVKDDRGEE